MQRGQPGGEGDDESLERQRERLARLRMLEGEVAAAKERERDLEVERIEADVALEAASAPRQGITDRERADELADALARRRDLERSLDDLHAGPARGPRGEQAEVERLRAAAGALRDWLEAPSRDPRNRIPKAAHAVLVAACVAAIIAAFAVHPIFIVILIPIAVPIGFLAMTGQDTVWLRLGAERRYLATGVQPPREWEEGPVRDRAARLDEERTALESRIAERAAAREAAARTAQAGSRDDAETELATAMELAEADARVRRALSEAGLTPEDLDADLEHWLARVHRARAAARELGETAAQRRALSGEAEDLRQRIHLFLTRHGAAPAGGRADSDSLSRALERVAGGDAPPASD